MQQDNILELFTTIIAHKDLSMDLNVMENICYKIKKKYESRFISNSLGYQSENIYPHLDWNKELTKTIENFINEKLIKIYSLKKEYEVDNMWININCKYAYNKVHIHPISFFSGVFYIKCPKNCGNLVLHKSSVEESFFKNDKDITEATPINSMLWELEPIENRLIIFPGWLSHSVKQNLNQEDRISISFNTKEKENYDK